MNGLGEILFGPLGNSLSIIALGLKILGALIMCCALPLLGRRSEVGWWLAIGSFSMFLLAGTFAVPLDFLSSAVLVTLYVAGSWAPPLVGIAVCFYGLLAFRKAPATTLLTREILLRRFQATDIVGPAIIALIFAGATLIPALVLNFSMSAANLSLPLTAMFVGGAVQGLLPAGLVGLAHGSRWAWFLIAGAALVSIAGTTMAAQGSVLIFLYLAQAVLAVYAWGRWGGLTEQPARP